MGISAAQADEANAKRLLKAMSDYLAAEKAMSFDYDVNLELVSTRREGGFPAYKKGDPG